MLDKTTMESLGQLTIAVLDQEEEFMVKSFVEDINRFKLSGYKMENGSGMVVANRLVALTIKNLTTINRYDQPCYEQKPHIGTFHR